MKGLALLMEYVNKVAANNTAISLVNVKQKLVTKLLRKIELSRLYCQIGIISRRDTEALVLYDSFPDVFILHCTIPF